MDEKSGIIGMNNDFVVNLRDNNDNIKDIPQTTPNLSDNITLKPTSFRTNNFGIIMFFKKNIYQPIPNDLKIFFGDDYIIEYARRKKKQCATICGQEIIHCGSLSSKAFIDLGKKENKLFVKHIFPWYKRIINFYQRDTQYVFFFLFIKLSFKKSQK